MRARRALGMADCVIARGGAIERPVARTANGGERCVGLDRVWPGVGPCCAVRRGFALDAVIEASRAPVRMGSGLCAYWVGGHSSLGPFRDPVNGRAARVRERFDDLRGAPREVLDQVTDDNRVQFSPAEQAWIEDPVAGRVVLVGDAWHAPTPSMVQSASLAAEDALVLASELRAHGIEGVDAALARYAQRRRIDA